MTAAADARIALAEDIGSGDLSASLIPARAVVAGVLYAREKTVLCGQAWFEACFLQMDRDASFSWRVPEGGETARGMAVCEVRGRARALLATERSALNFLQTLSATASVARRMQALAGNATVCDTRKTIPKLRVAQKYAVRIGGAKNQRRGLYDGILIKENHLAAAGGIAVALRKARRAASPDQIQIEVRSLQELSEALAAGASRILLDNFGAADLKRAVRQARGRAELEASGGVSEKSLKRVAETGVDRISIGALTKNVRAADFSFIVGPLPGPGEKNDHFKFSRARRKT